MYIDKFLWNFRETKTTKENFLKIRETLLKHKTKLNIITKEWLSYEKTRDETISWLNENTKLFLGKNRLSHDLKEKEAQFNKYKLVNYNNYA